MTGRRLVGGLCAVILLLTAAVPAGAQTETQSATDSQGRYTIVFPADWNVITVDSKMLSKNLPKDASPAGALPKDMMSMMVAVAPPGDQGEIPIHMLIMTLPVQASPEDLKNMPDFGKALPGYKLVRDGTATIAGRQAYYQYFTWQPAAEVNLYEVMVVFSVGQAGFLIMAGTVNEPERVRKDFPVISGILETFRPNEKVGTTP